MGNNIQEQLPDALTGWYDLPANAKVLNLKDISDLKEETYDCIIMAGVLEKEKDPVALLKKIKTHLTDNGKLLLGANNRLGVRFFCGDRDLYTNRVFDSLEDYFRAYSKPEDGFFGRSYDRSKLDQMLADAGFSRKQYYSVFPTLEAPTHIFRQDYLPNESLVDRLFPIYHYPPTLFLEEQRLWQGLIDNGLFHKMANAYLIECSVDPQGTLSDILHVTSSLERGRENALYTIICGDENGTPEYVIKKAAYEEGKKRLKELKEHLDALSERGIRVVESEYREGSFRMPYIQAQSSQQYLEDLLLSGDLEGFLAKMDRFRDLILRSSDRYVGTYIPPLNPHAADPAKEKRKQKRNTIQTELFQNAFLDMVPLNAFYIEEEDDFVFYDQEFCMRDYPVNAVISRMIATFYAGNPALYSRYSRDKLYERYGLLDTRDYWFELEGSFLGELRNSHELRDYHKAVKPDSRVIHSNRQQMNFSADDYRRLFIDIFDMTEGRKVVLFGSGKFAEQFLELYGADLDIAYLVDNNSSRIGSSFHGITIKSPEELKQFGHGEYKVIICIKNYLSVMEQLENMGIREYSIYDAGHAYQRKPHPIYDPLQSDSVIRDNADAGKKKYHIGYIAGVFDLYHVGHLNMFKRAKELCDYLIVGVVSDEGVRKHKKTDPFVPFEERIEMVRSCRYVDEAEEIPLMFEKTEDAWKLYHFDVQFSGSDYAQDESWLRNKEFLEKHGATIHFFPYTESTSSTKLKELIEKKLL